MFEAIRNGILLGLLLSVLIGPVFFILINVSIKEGFRSAIYLDLGIILSDAVCILVSYLGMAALLEDRQNRLYFIIGGSIILIVMGVLKILPDRKLASDKAKDKVSELELQRSNPFLLAIKGFFYNLLNPSVLLFWITTVGAAVTLYEGDAELVWGQFGSTLGIVFGLDILKAWFAKKMRNFVTHDKIDKANRIIGVIFVAFAIVLLVRAFMGKI
ncbi:MAG: LysE family translocator [Flavobacteriales bacterium]